MRVQKVGNQNQSFGKLIAPQGGCEKYIKDIFYSNSSLLNAYTDAYESVAKRNIDNQNFDIVFKKISKKVANAKENFVDYIVGVKNNSNNKLVKSFSFVKASDDVAEDACDATKLIKALQKADDEAVKMNDVEVSLKKAYKNSDLDSELSLDFGEISKASSSYSCDDDRAVIMDITSYP